MSPLNLFGFSLSTAVGSRPKKVAVIGLAAGFFSSSKATFFGDCLSAAGEF